MSSLSLDFGALAKTPGEPSVETAVKYKTDKQSVDYYSGETIDKSDRALILSRLFRSVAVVETDEDNSGPWIWSIIDLTFPGLSALLIRSSGLYEPNPLNLSEDDIRVLTTHDDDQDDIEKYLSDDANIMVIDNVMMDDNYNPPEWVEIIAYSASLLYTIGKRPDLKNLTGFTLKRVKAYFSKVGFVQDESAWSLSDSNIPRLEAYQTFHSYFSSHIRLREVTATTLIDWTLDMSVTPDQDAVATFCKLWKDNGFVHVIIIRGLLVRFEPVVIQMPALKLEILSFIQDYQKFSDSNDKLIRFDRVIKGDRSTVMPSRTYPELFKIAKQIAAISDKTFESYAPDVGESSHWDEFVQRCSDLGLGDFN